MNEAATATNEIRKCEFDFEQQLKSVQPHTLNENPFFEPNSKIEENDRKETKNKIFLKYFLETKNKRNPEALVKKLRA